MGLEEVLKVCEGAQLQACNVRLMVTFVFSLSMKCSFTQFLLDVSPRASFPTSPSLFPPLITYQWSYGGLAGFQWTLLPLATFLVPPLPQLNLSAHQSKRLGPGLVCFCEWRKVLEAEWGR